MKNQFAKTIVLLSALLLAGILIFSCGEAEKKKKPGETAQVEKEVPAKISGPVKLGVAGPHSGDLASYGLPTVNAAKLVVREINAKGGILGQKVELLVEDDLCKPEMATNTATKLVSSNVDVVLGHICSGATKAALGIYKDSNVIIMSPSATNPALTQSGLYPNFYRTIASDDTQAKLEVDFTLNVLKANKIAVIHDKGDYGKGLAEFAKKILEESDKAEIALYEGVTPGALDYSAIVQKIKRSGAQAIIFGGYHPEASKIVTQIKKKKMNIHFVSDDGVKDDTFIKVAGKFAEGVYATGPKDTSKQPLTIKALKDHEQEFGEAPGAFYLNAYSAAIALLNAIEKAGSINYKAIEKALKTEYVETPLGKISFDEKGDAIGVGFSMYQVRNGKYVEVQ